MKKRYFALAAALLAGGILVAGFGAFLESRLPADRAFLYEEHSWIALPFALMADRQLDDVLLSANEIQDTTPDDDVTTGTETDPITDDTEHTEVTENTTVASEETTAVSEETTAPATTDTTEPSQTQETTVPPTEPSETTAPPVDTDYVAPPVYTPDPMPDVPAPIVGYSYFEDALFIGDSRMCGLRDYSRLGDADYFCDVGMSIFNLWYTKCADYDFYQMFLDERLKEVKYGKIYVALGINECGYAAESFKSEYQKMVNMLREQQPDAVIVLQGIMAVTRGFAGQLPYFQPGHIRMLNEFIKSLADGNKVFYIDPNPVFTNSDGFLLTSVSADGCHLNAKDHWMWAQWIRSCPPG